MRQAYPQRRRQEGFSIERLLLDDSILSVHELVLLFHELVQLPLSTSSVVFSRLNSLISKLTCNLIQHQVINLSQHPATTLKHPLTAQLSNTHTYRNSIPAALVAEQRPRLCSMTVVKETGNKIYILFIWRQGMARQFTSQIWS